MKETEEKKTNNKTAGIVGVTILAIMALGNLAETGGNRVTRLIGFIILAMILVTAVLVRIVLRKAGPTRPGPSEKKEEHCHDRLHEHSEPCQPGTLLHYKKQLDGFLSAGVIEKDEYNLLLSKYRRQLED